MRKKLTVYNMITSVFLEIVNIVVNFILPALIIRKFGSETNGLINSITQFLAYITLIESGIGGVIKSIFYKNLSKSNTKDLSVTVKSAESFFRKVGYIFLVYIVVLAIIYPNFVNSSFDAFYTISLIVIISISSCMQYFFGITSQLLIQSDNRSYLVNISKIVVNTLSTIVMVVFIKMNFSIQVVKLAGAVVCVASPLFYYAYVKKHYKLDKNAKPDKNVISQRWDGFAHHIAYFIHKNTDVAVLTIFANVLEVSVYSVYNLILSGLHSILSTITNAISASFGGMIARKEDKKLKTYYRAFNYLYFLVAVAVFSIAGFTILDFINLYVAGVDDVNYIRPAFAVIIIIAQALYSIRCSYSMIIYASGDFKQTRRGGWIEAALNIILSVILVSKFGLVGVAIGTLVAMIYRTIDFIIYISKHIVMINLKEIFIQYVVNTLAVIIIALIVNNIPFMAVSNYLIWILKAIIIAVIDVAVIFVINIVFFRKKLIDSIKLFTKPLIKKLFKKKADA